jgi:hypothetical protein
MADGMLQALIVAHEWGVRPSVLMNEWSEADMLIAFEYIKWKHTPRGN